MRKDPVHATCSKVHDIVLKRIIIIVQADIVQVSIHRFASQIII